jgi:hypothetical protein
LRSLKRTIQEKSAPFTQISKNVHDDLQGYLDVEDTENIKSCFSAVNSFYLLTLPASSRIYCFDTRARLQDGSAKTTYWTSISPKAFCETKDRITYFGMAGYVGKHDTYLDNASVYRMLYYTTWIDFGNPIQTSILKRIVLTLIGGLNQAIVFKWAYDFEGTFSSRTNYIPTITNPAEYGVAEYNTTAEYSANLTINTMSVNAGGSGKVLQFGFEANVSGVPVSIQKIEIFSKDGRV